VARTRSPSSRPRPRLFACSTDCTMMNASHSYEQTPITSTDPSVAFDEENCGAYVGKGTPPRKSRSQRQARVARTVGPSPSFCRGCCAGILLQGIIFSVILYLLIRNNALTVNVQKSQVDQFVNITLYDINTLLHHHPDGGANSTADGGSIPGADEGSDADGN
jgi:hypothetical protein